MKENKNKSVKTENSNKSKSCTIDNNDQVERITEKTSADTFRSLLINLVPYVIIFLVVVLIRVFIITPVRVTGSSMHPYLKDGEILMLEKYDRNFKRYDIVVANAANTQIIKRIIGLPGEKIKYEDCKLYINDELVDDYVKECITGDFKLEDIYGYLVIPQDYYFVMGDNRKQSSDSRDVRIGLIKKDKIEGKAIFRIIPFSRFGNLKK